MSGYSTPGVPAPVIKKTEPIRCIVDTANDPHEISLDENVTRENMHPVEQCEAFKKLAEERGFGAEEIAARFGVTPHVVRQRLRLGAVSPKLMKVYRNGDLALDQLMAFAITEDHARQKAAYERLSYNRDASTIRRMLTETHVAATDRRAIFVGVEAYTEAGGTILRDLFMDDRGGYFEDVALLDLLVTGKLERAADAVREVEGWKWTQVHLDFPHERPTCNRRILSNPCLAAAPMLARRLGGNVSYLSEGTASYPPKMTTPLGDAQSGPLPCGRTHPMRRRRCFVRTEAIRRGAAVFLSLFFIMNRTT